MRGSHVISTWCAPALTSSPVKIFLFQTFACIYLGVIMLLVVMFGLFFEVADHYYQKVTIVVAFGLLSAVVTVSTISSWRRYKDIVILNRNA